eukprot:TRINITY_DN1047_c2_g1_i2.p1 TRINITY_DN1047_c2_g1~~TRINITY_DN1047_c2_g1_i2.p1  ORF type:complete len:350 (-),score=81.69 TRINITY_DN1047_c2_g1_i2:156-1154(-)
MDSSSLDETEVMSFPSLFFNFFTLVFLAATQDIAVDGWAITMLSHKNKGYGATCQTIGLNVGYFLSFTIFLALNSPEFCNAYIRTANNQMAEGIWTLGGFMRFWGYTFIVLTFVLWFFKKEELSVTEQSHKLSSVIKVYKQMWSVIRLPNMIELIMVLLLARVGFVATDSIAALKLIEKGFRKEDMALIVLMQFPVDILFAILSGRWSSSSSSSSASSSSPSSPSSSSLPSQLSMINNDLSNDSSSSSMTESSTTTTSSSSSSSDDMTGIFTPWIRFYLVRAACVIAIIIFVHTFDGTLTTSKVPNKEGKREREREMNDHAHPFILSISFSL